MGEEWWRVSIIYVGKDIVFQGSLCCGLALKLSTRKDTLRPLRLKKLIELVNINVGQGKSWIIKPNFAT